MKLLMTAWQVLCAFLVASCTVAGEEPKYTRDIPTKITLDYPEHPRRIRFDVYQTPYISDQGAQLPMHEKIRLGMRKYAQEELEKFGYCPNGFTGPDIVLHRKLDIHSFFFVDCVPYQN